jgi:cytochrome bd-type quinol oxidase subunit 2
VDNLTRVGRILAWTTLAFLSIFLVTYLPTAFGPVGDESHALFFGRKLLFPLFVVSYVSGIFFANGRRRTAFWIVGITLVCLVLVELRAIWPSLAHP